MDFDLTPWPKDWPLNYNGNSTPCDMVIGPCACGAWHNDGEFFDCPECNVPYKGKGDPNCQSCGGKGYLRETVKEVPCNTSS